MANGLANIFIFEVENVLDDIIGIRILDKNACILCDGQHKELLLLWVCRVDAFLHDAASVHMAGDRATVFHHCIVDELLILIGPRV